MLNVIESIRMRLKRPVACFGLYGYDFMIDEDTKVWLIEINVNPALTTNTNTLIQAIPPVVQESICSLPYIEQKRAISSSPNTRKVPSAPPPPIPSPSKTNANNSPSNFSKIFPRTNEQQTSITQKSPITNLNHLNQERSKLNRSSDSFVSPLTTTNHSFPTINATSNETMVMRYQTIQRYKTNFELLKPATVIAEEWKNLDRTQKDRLVIEGPKALEYGAVASTSSQQQQNNWLVSGRQLTVVDTKTLGLFLSFFFYIRTIYIFQSSSLNSSDTSSITTSGTEIPPLQITTTFRKLNTTRAHSVKLRRLGLLPEKPSIIKEIVNATHSWKYDDWSNQQDSIGPLTKSALIYRLMRSRLEANLAKSISANRNRSNSKKKLSSYTIT
ncbi:unnamed protein product [Rotaria sordida]|uniref:Uncharacterized protein n=1 Tax=Rotaria sordida TaxID=392033 RepID=A0A819QGB0_9BILA|nr:unnamed protein product [Rotaria sordida]CAF4028114.1 unnamed protein product [Rotaria sordida]CAF4092136.1 unnamed protein product [Rotaria sordida]